MYYSKLSFHRVTNPLIVRVLELSLCIILFRLKPFFHVFLKFLPASLASYLRARMSEIELTDHSERTFFVYGKAGRKCLRLSSDFRRRIEIPSAEVKGLSFNVAPLETIQFYTHRLWTCDLEVEVELFDCNDIVLDCFTSRYPVSVKKHGIGRNRLGQDWIQYDLDLECIEEPASYAVISVRFVRGSLLALGSDIHNKDIVETSSPILISAIDFWQNSQQKNKLVIVAESMTDPAWFMSDDILRIKMPNYCKLRDLSVAYARAVSIADSTLPHLGSFFSGKFPSEHLIGDYSAEPKAQALDQDTFTIVQAAREKGYKTIGLTSYGRLGFEYCWPALFDEYFNTEAPFFDDAPNASQLVRTINANKHVSTFYYVHFTRLHLPLLSTDRNQAPCVVSLNHVDSAISKGNYKELYLSQYEIFDLELGQILSYLEGSGRMENFEIVLTGDHGVKMPPEWKNQISANYDLYEEHVRVPLLMKKVGPVAGKRYDMPVSSQKVIFDDIALDKSGIMHDDTLGVYAISQTIYHPNKSNLSICITSQEYKFWAYFASYFEGKSDIWAPDDCLLFISDGHSFDESKDLSAEHPDIKSEFVRLLQEILGSDANVS